MRRDPDDVRFDLDQAIKNLDAHPELLPPIDTPVRERVLAGARFLDIVHPGWADLIELKTFDITCSSLCVCGQVFDYGGGTPGFHQFTDRVRHVRRLALRGDDGSYDYERFRSAEFRLGFDTWADNEWKTLQSAWVAQIRKRQT